MNCSKLSILCNLLNSNNVQKLSLVKIGFSTSYIKLLILLVKEGFIRTFYVDFFDNVKTIFILLKYINDRSFFSFRCLHYNSFLLYPNSNNFDFIIVSTKKGVLIKNSKTHNKGTPLIKVTLL